MSLGALTYVWEKSKQEGGSLLVMLALADYSDEDGRSFPKIATLAKKSRLSERQVKRVIEKLEEAGELEVERTGRASHYRILKGHGGTSAAPPSDADVTSDGTPTAPLTGRGRHPEPSTTPDSNATPPTGEGARPFALTLVTDDQKWTPVVQSVDKKKVTPHEDRTAREVLTIFNEVFMTSFTTKATDYIKSIILRLREHPEVTLEQHRALIEREHDKAWWQTRPPTPRIIYGNPGQYENCLYDDGSHTRPTNDRERMMDTLNALEAGTIG